MEKRSRYKLVISPASMLFATIFVLAVVQNGSAQPQSSSYGTDFFIGFMRNVGGNPLVSLRVVIGTPAASAGYRVTTGRADNRPIREGTVTSGIPISVEIPSDPRRLNLQVTEDTFANRDKGVRIEATGTELLFVIAENFVSPLNHGVFLAYPCLTVPNGMPYEYYVVSTDATDITFSQFLMVGCEDDTTISITPTAEIRIPQDPQMRAAITETIDAGTMSHEFTLNQFQTLLVRSSTDLSGTKIVSNKPLTVISGHECANVPVSDSGCEPLAIHVPPLALWGSRFLLAPFAGREDSRYYKVVSAVETEIVYTCGSLTEQLLTDTLIIDDVYCYVESNAPLLIAQLSIGGSIDRNGDPAIAMISPINQYLNTISFVSLPRSTFPTNFISVTVPEEHYDEDMILLDGNPLECDWEEILNREQEVVGYGCSTSVTSERGSPTQHTVTHQENDGRISVLVYGFNARLSLGYAYLAGLDVTAGNDGGPIDPIEFTFLETFDIANYPRVQELLRQADSSSPAITIPDGLIFGDQIATSAYVNENGVISFERPWGFALPDRFPTEYFWTRQRLAVAPFWSDNDIRRQGTVRYFSYAECIGIDCDFIQEGENALIAVNTYINELAGEDENIFTGTWILIAEWDQVHPSPHGEDNPPVPEEQLEVVNTYQAVIITDILRTFTIFSYQCGDIQWSALGRNRAAVVGFNANGQFFQNHPASGFSAVGESVSCRRRLRRKRQMEPININMELPVDPGLLQRVAACLKAVEGDELNKFGDLSESLAMMQATYPCPCSKAQADGDRGRFQPQRDRADCYISTVPVEYVGILRTLQLTQQCCYDQNSEALMTSQRNGFAGTYLLFHPHLQTEEYNATDKDFRDKCCGQLGAEVYCDMYFERRVISTCTQPEQYEPVGIASALGDPHYTNIGGRHYDFQATGDFTVVDVLDGNDNPIFSLQNRNIEISPWYGATVQQAFAFGNQDFSFQFGTQPQDGFRVWQTKPGGCREITSKIPSCSRNVGDFVCPGVARPIQGDILLCRTGDDLIVAHYKSGVNLVLSYRGNYDNFVANIPRIHVGRIRGVIGDFSGHFRGLQNEFFDRDTSEETLYDPLRHRWEVERSVSLFCNPRERINRPNERRRRQDDDFTPIFFDELNITETQQTLCQNNRECIFDLIITEDPDVAIATLNDLKQTNETRETQNNFPPNITGPVIFRVNLGEESVLKLTVSDPGDEYTLTVRGGLPENSQLENISDMDYEFRWTLQEIMFEALVFVANDSQGAATIYIPTVEICPCENGGNCSREGLLTNNATILLNCDCTEAFDGSFCEEDRNGCSEIECFEGVECMDVPAPGVGAVCGSCPPGYTGDALKCYDIDECNIDSTLCHQVCVNTDGSFFCSCNDSFQLIDGTNQCEDIDECAGVNDCQQNCLNSIGSYSCSCNEGFSLDAGGRNCTADVPCDGACSHGCAVIDGAEQCFCPSGLEISIPGGTQCGDQNECEDDPCDQVCVNTDGSFMCSCLNGYQLLDDGRSCEDIDDCLEAALGGFDLCENTSNSRCVNNEGSFACVCVPGYMLNENGTCQIIDNEPPPPPPPVIRPASSEDNSINFTSPTLTPELFTPERRQRFRKVAAEAVTNYCSGAVCELIISAEEKLQLDNLKVDPTNIALPSSLMFEDDEGQLVFTFYVQVGDGFLSREQLGPALMTQQAVEEFRDAGFFAPLPTTPPTTQPTTMATTQPTTMATTQRTTIATTQPMTMATTQELTLPPIEVDCTVDSDPGPCRGSFPRYFFNTQTGVCEQFTYGGCEGNGNNFESVEECNQQCNTNECPPFCTMEYCTNRPTRTAPCTINQPVRECSSFKCQTTYCHTCYYDDEYRPLNQQECKTCSRFEIEQRSRCFRRWAVCTRRADGALYPKTRKRDRTEDLFKCYEHPCV